MSDTPDGVALGDASPAAQTVTPEPEAWRQERRQWHLAEAKWRVRAMWSNVVSGVPCLAMAVGMGSGHLWDGMAMGTAGVAANAWGMHRAHKQRKQLLAAADESLTMPEPVSRLDLPPSRQFSYATLDGAWTALDALREAFPEVAAVQAGASEREAPYRAAGADEPQIAALREKRKLSKAEIATLSGYEESVATVYSLLGQGVDRILEATPEADRHPADGVMSDLLEERLGTMFAVLGEGAVPGTSLDCLVRQADGSALLIRFTAHGDGSHAVQTFRTAPDGSTIREGDVSPLEAGAGLSVTGPDFEDLPAVWRSIHRMADDHRLPEIAAAVARTPNLAELEALEDDAGVQTAVVSLINVIRIGMGAAQDADDVTARFDALSEALAPDAMPGTTLVVGDGGRALRSVFEEGQRFTRSFVEVAGAEQAGTPAPGPSEGGDLGL